MTNLKRRIIAVGIIVLLFTVWLGRLSPEAGTEQETEAFYTDADVSALSNPVPQQIIVHVAGAVAEPGVYQLQEGQRVEDALQLAGVVEDSDLDALNRAALLTDGQKIVVPSVQEAEQTASVTTAVTEDYVDLNRANLQQLMSLPGIGQVKAQAIVDYRTENNGFQTVEEIQQVNGIGEAIFSQIKDKIKI